MTNQGAEPATILHRGVRARLTPGESTEVFNAEPFSGDWGVVVDTGITNDACAAGASGAEMPQVDVVIVTACGLQ